MTALAKLIELICWAVGLTGVFVCVVFVVFVLWLVLLRNPDD